MATAGSVLANRIETALAAAAVYTQAGVASMSGRIFRGLGGYLGGRCRGRLPFIEYDIVSQAFNNDSRDGGQLAQRVTVRVHVGGRDLGTASALTEAVLAAALASIRSDASDNLTDMGDDAIGEIQPGPWGHQRDAEMTIMQTFDRDSYEVV